MGQDEGLLRRRAEEQIQPTMLPRYTDKVKTARTVEKQHHTLIEDPLEDNNSNDFTEPLAAKRVSRSQIDAFDIKKCAICQQDETMLTKTKEQD